MTEKSGLVATQRKGLMWNKHHLFALMKSVVEKSSAWFILVGGVVLLSRFFFSIVSFWFLIFPFNLVNGWQVLEHVGMSEKPP